MKDQQCILDCLMKTSHELRDLCGVRLDEVAAPVDPLTFYRNYVAANKPCIITGGINCWPAGSLWSIEYFKQKLGSKKVPVAVTPDGRADAVTQSEECIPVFALPCEVEVTMSSFLDYLTSTESSSQRNVAYMQQQNDCLRQEFRDLMDDIHPDLGWAHEVFGGKPEAINLWVGNEKSVTSFHKDHYENLFAVIKGCKIFTLLPPCDVYRLALQEFDVAEYKSGGSDRHPDEHFSGLDCELHLQIQSPQNSVKWCPIDPHCKQEERAKFPLFFHSHLPAPVEVAVKPGQILYLPSLWHHSVRQTCEKTDVCIGVNFWYDMPMGTNYSSFGLAARLAEAL